ncbi:hypothetical protein GCM10023259_087380 [Thermocatellispora tengchongensis]
MGWVAERRTGWDRRQARTRTETRIGIGIDRDRGLTDLQIGRDRRSHGASWISGTERSGALRNQPGSQIGRDPASGRP